MKTLGCTFQNHEKSGWALWGRLGVTLGDPKNDPPPDPPFWTPRRRTPLGPPKTGGTRCCKKGVKKGGPFFFVFFPVESL
jgi:hypothetical protein